MLEAVSISVSFRAALTSNLTTTQVEGSQHLQSASKEPSLHPAKYRRKSKMFMNQGLQKSTRRYICQIDLPEIVSPVFLRNTPSSPVLYGRQIGTIRSFRSKGSSGKVIIARSVLKNLL